MCAANNWWWWHCWCVESGDVNACATDQLCAARTCMWMKRGLAVRLYPPRWYSIAMCGTASSCVHATRQSISVPCHCIDMITMSETMWWSEWKKDHKHEYVIQYTSDSAQESFDRYRLTGPSLVNASQQRSESLQCKSAISRLIGNPESTALPTHPPQVGQPMSDRRHPI